MLLALSGLNAVLRVLAPDDRIDDIGIEQRTNDEIEIHVTWRAEGVFTQSLFRGEWSAAEIIYRLFGEMQDYLADSDMAWGQARPPCPGHSHPRGLVREGKKLRWNCPADGIGPHAFSDLLDQEDSGQG
jgi:hypothetical protein